MSLHIFIIECVIFMVVFGGLVFGMLLISPLTFVSDYPQEIQEQYYTSQSKEKNRKKLTAAMAKKSGCFDCCRLLARMDGAQGGC